MDYNPTILQDSIKSIDMEADKGIHIQELYNLLDVVRNIIYEPRHRNILKQQLEAKKILQDLIPVLEKRGQTLKQDTIDPIVSALGYNSDPMVLKNAKSLLDHILGDYHDDKYNDVKRIKKTNS